VRVYEERTYRKLVAPEGLKSFPVQLKDSDLLISAERDLTKEASEALEKYRSQIEDYIVQDPKFKITLSPYKVKADAPEIVRKMAQAGFKAGVGPMAAVAGVVSQFIANELKKYSKEIIIENGGDIFIISNKPHTIAIFAGDNNPFSMKLGLSLKPYPEGAGICTSSGTVGPSLSFGKADSVTIISADAALADACATAIGNIVKTKDDIKEGLEVATSIEEIEGALIIVEDKLGAWGSVKLEEV